MRLKFLIFLFVAITESIVLMSLQQRLVPPLTQLIVLLFFSLAFNYFVFVFHFSVIANIRYPTPVFLLSMLSTSISCRITFLLFIPNSGDENGWWILSAMIAFLVSMLCSIPYLFKEGNRE